MPTVARYAENNRKVDKGRIQQKQSEYPCLSTPYHTTIHVHEHVYQEHNYSRWCTDYPMGCMVLAPAWRPKSEGPARVVDRVADECRRGTYAPTYLCKPQPDTCSILTRLSQHI